MLKKILILTILINHSAFADYKFEDTKKVNIKPLDELVGAKEKQLEVLANLNSSLKDMNQAQNDLNENLTEFNKRLQELDLDKVQKDISSVNQNLQRLESKQKEREEATRRMLESIERSKKALENTSLALDESIKRLEVNDSQRAKLRGVSSENAEVETLKQSTSKNQ